MSTDILKNKGLVRTDLYCHHCGKNFIAMINYDFSGNHEIECPCGHTHCRTIKNGIVTGDRWDGRNDTIKIEKRHIWQHDTLPIQTSSASAYLRNLWLNRGDL